MRMDIIRLQNHSNRCTDLQSNVPILMPDYLLKGAK
jgi:hypothetical protein